MKLKLSILFLIISFCGYTQVEESKEQQTYTDYVSDEDGNRLQGIRVEVIEGDSDITDFNGKFSIRAKYGDEIVLSKNNNRIDSYIYNGNLEYIVDDNTSDKKKSRKSKTSYKVALDSAKYFVKRKPLQSIPFVEKALKVTNNSKKSAKAFEVLADAFYELKQFDVAESNYNNAYGVLTKSISLELKLAKTYYKNSKYEQSELLYQKVLQNKKTIPFQKIVALEGLASLSKRIGNNTQSIRYLEKALSISEKYKIAIKISKLNTKLAEVNSLEGNKDKSDLYISNSISFAKKESKNKIIIQSNVAADFYRERNSISQEIEYRKQTLQKLEEVEMEEIGFLDNTISKPKVKYDIGTALVKQKKYKEAISYFLESAIEANSAKDIETEKVAVRGLSEVYATIGDDKNAVFNYNRLSKLVDFSFKNKEEEIKRAAAISKDIANKQNRILSLETNKALNASKYQLTIANNKRQKLIIYSLSGGLLLMLLSLFYMLKSNKQSKLTNNLLALKSLRSQMNPHFIFNALNSVNSFISNNDERAANRYLTDFSTLMRSVLENSEQDFIPLSEEIELLNLYLKLEHARFKDKFDYTFTENIYSTSFQIPPMLLQPYVENAVWHGLRYKKEKGFLQIELKQIDNETLEITISDNGIGRKKSTELKSTNQLKRKSKGMHNIQQRITILNEMHPNKLQVTISDLHEDETGTKVLLRLKK